MNAGPVMVRKVKANGGKREESRDRAEILEAIGLWYEQRVEQGRARYGPNKQRATSLDVPSEYIAPSFFGRGAGLLGFWNPTGKPTAHGSATRRSGRSREPVGYGSTLDVMNRLVGERYRAAELARAEVLGLVNEAMFDLILHQPTYHRVMEMSAAGYSQERIAEKLKISKPLVSQYFECAVTWVSSYFLRWKKQKAHEKIKRRRTREGDLYAGCERSDP